MYITYERIFSILNSKFNLVTGQKKYYFLDKSNRIVASIDGNLITMFYDYQDHSREIWNHHGKVAITFAKNFNVNGQLCDILCIDGLCGACNDFVMNRDFFIKTTNNEEIRHLLDNHGNSLQKQFESLNYKEKIAVLEKVKGATFKGANISGIQLFGDNTKYKLGNCGHLSSANGIASFDICGEMQIHNIIVNNKMVDGFDINIINFKNICQKPNYEEVYNFYRQENDWCYNFGYNTVNSEKTRAFTERRRYSTVDENSIHFPKSELLDPIYENGTQSQLQMLYILNSLLDKQEAEKYISSHYNFNIRNFDLNKQKVKKINYLFLNF